MCRFAREVTGQNKLEYARMLRLHDGQVVKGVPFFCGQSGKGGQWVTLVVMPQTTREQLADAMAELVRTRDVESLCVTRITELI